MIITHFPNTLGGVQLVKGRFTQTLDSTLFGFSKNCRTQISFEKLVNYLGEGKPNFFDAQQIAASLAICPKPPTFPGNDQRGFPFGNPKLMFFFLFLLLVVISFGYLAIYTNEYLLLLNNVDRNLQFNFDFTV